MSNTRVKIDLAAGTVELEGTEQFVIRYLDEFKFLLNNTPVDTRPPKTSSNTTRRPTVKKSVSVGTASENADTKPAVKQKQKKGAPKVVPTRFDVHGSGDIPSLQNFFNEKKPGVANGTRIAVIGYYITELLGQSTFSEGQIDYAYKMLKLNRPGHLHQVMINNKNEKDLYEQSADDPSNWVLTRTGEIFVSDQLPTDNSHEN